MENCGYAVQSEDFKGFAVENRGEDEEIKRQLGGAACLRRVSESLAFVYYDYPVERRQGSEYPFGLQMKVYGLLSEQELAKSGVLTLRESPYTRLNGRGCLIGFLDTGISYALPEFRYEDGTTRLVGLWDQTLVSNGLDRGEEAAFYGRMYTREELDLALLEENPYAVIPSRDENGHGDALVRAAAGGIVPERVGLSYGGVAPQASIAVVKLRRAKEYLRRYYEIPEEAVCFAEDDLVYAAEWLRTVADREKQPLVLCVAVGSNLGNHTGKTTFGKYLDKIAQIPGVCVMVAGGNEGGLGHHFLGRVSKDGYEDVELLVGNGEKGFVTELWAMQPDRFTVELTSPSGEKIPRSQARAYFNKRYPLFFEGGSVEIQSNLFDSSTGTQGIQIRFHNVPSGIWKIRVYWEGEFSGGYHMWLPLAPFLQSDTAFLRPNPYQLICDPGAAAGAITLTAYDASDGVLNLNASYGYTVDGRIKPDVAAPEGEAGFEGSGMAAAFAAGCTALLYEATLRRADAFILDTQVIKQLLTATAERGGGEYPNREWGYGKLNLYHVFLNTPGRT